jgi:hypothetical protein
MVHPPWQLPATQCSLAGQSVSAWQRTGTHAPFRQTSLGAHWEVWVQLVGLVPEVQMPSEAQYMPLGQSAWSKQ